MSFWKISPWVSRLIILAVAVLFVMISLKFILDPRAAAAASGITIEPGLGYTNTRAGFGGFPLGFALILVFCLFSPRRLLAALAAIATVVAVILFVRLYAAAADHTFSASAYLLGPEAAITVVSLFGVWMETARRAHDSHAG
jgi:preprotein translocase subunit SecD